MRIGLLLALAVALLSPLTASAQLSLPGIGGTLGIELSPQYPQPGDTVQLTVTSSNIDLSQSAITWLSGSQTLAQGSGVIHASVTAGNLGRSTPVEVDVTAPDGEQLSADATITPAELDLLASSDSYIPPFYRGRALPSTGTNLVLQALAHFQNPDGTAVPDSGIVYTWKRDGEVLGDVSGAGHSVVHIPVTHLFATDEIEVDARTEDGLQGAAATYELTPAPTDLALYEDHPLYGILYDEALQQQNSVPEAEMTFAAVPYFAPVADPNDPALSYTWHVNGTVVAPSSAVHNEITINGSNSNGQATIGLEVTHASDLLLDLTGSWFVTLTSGIGPAGQFGS